MRKRKTVMILGNDWVMVLPSNPGKKTERP